MREYTPVFMLEYPPVGPICAQIGSSDLSFIYAMHKA